MLNNKNIEKSFIYTLFIDYLKMNILTRCRKIDKLTN